MSESAYRRNQCIVAGAFRRGGVRRELAVYGVEFKETKTLPESVFQVKCTPDEWQEILAWLRRNQ